MATADASPHADLSTRFPAWSIWRSDAGRWWATYRGELGQAAADAGCSRTVDADTLAGLSELLNEQERIRPETTP